MTASALSQLVADPSRTGIFLDFDGTLSNIVLYAGDARPLPGVPELLRDLDRAFGLVAVVSGRSAHQLVEWLGSDIEIWGVHGAETNRSGSVRLSDHAAAFQDLMDRVKQEAATEVARLDLPGVVVEDKGIMIGLHFRGAEDVERARSELDRVAQELTDRHGLLRAGGRLAYELRPPSDFSKAAIVLARSREENLKAVAFMGDDRVDLPGFDALDELADQGVATVRVAVNSDEAPSELIERADEVVDGPGEAVEWLRGLADAAGRGS